MSVFHLAPLPSAPLAVEIGGHAVSRDAVVLGLGETPGEAVADARSWHSGALPPGAAISPISASARARVMEWGEAVAELRIVAGVLCTPEEARRLSEAPPPVRRRG